MSIELTVYELKACIETPGLLRELAEYHSVQETLANGMDFTESAEYHRNRRIELLAEADRIQAEWEA